MLPGIDSVGLRTRIDFGTVPINEKTNLRVRYPISIFDINSIVIIHRS